MLTLKEILENHQRMIEEGKKRREKLIKERGNKKEWFPMEEVKVEEKNPKKKPSKKKKSKKEEAPVEILSLDELNK